MFSEREEKILEVLGTKRLTAEEISIKLFKGKKDKPFDATITVSNSIRRIIKKCEYYKESWTLTKFRSNGKLYVYKDLK